MRLEGGGGKVGQPNLVQALGKDNLFTIHDL